MSDRDQMYAYDLYATIMDRIDELEDILNLEIKTKRFTPYEKRINRK